jgi:hypothetical protein
VADRAEHHVLFVEHRHDARFHPPVRLDQPADVVRPLRRKLARQRLRPGERLDPPGQLGERPGDPPQQQPHREHQRGEQDQRLRHESLHRPGIAGPIERAGGEPLPVAGGDAGEEHAGPLQRHPPADWPARLKTPEHTRIGQRRAARHAHPLRPAQALLGENLAQRRGDLGFGAVAGQDRGSRTALDPHPAREALPFAAVRAPAPDQPLGGRAGRGGGQLNRERADQMLRAPVFGRAEQQHRRNSLRDEQRRGDREQHLAEQAAGPEPHSPPAAAMRRTSAAKR